MPSFGTTTQYTPGSGDFRWLGSKHASDTGVTVAISTELLTSGTHYDAQTGEIPAGLPLGKLTGLDVYGPYSAAATDGRQFLAGFLLAPEALPIFGDKPEFMNGALLEHGSIVPEFVPTSPVLSTATKTTGSFVFRGVDYVAAV